VKEILPLSLTFCMLWFLSNYFYNYGLRFSSITSAEVLSNTSPIWVYLVGLSCLVPAANRDKFEPVKAAMLVLSLAGFILIAVQDSKSSSSSSN
jgi:solute carrier family 35, member F5